MSTTAQIAANQANAQLSTGPQTEAGKAASSRNNFRHGCTGKFMLLPQESLTEFNELKDALNGEHQPATPTEALLVERMVQHFWLAQRALRLQGFCFDDGIHQPDLQKLSVYLRYQSTHDRAFHKCLNELQKLRAEQCKAAERPTRLQREIRAEVRKTELHEARLASLQAKTELDQAKADAQTGPSLRTLRLSHEEQVREAFARDAAQQAELEAFLKSQAA